MRKSGDKNFLKFVFIASAVFLLSTNFPCPPPFRPDTPPLLGILHQREYSECSQFFSAGYTLFVFPYKSENWQIVIDMEMMSFEYGKKWEWGKGNAVEVYLPIYYTYAGFMDSFVLKYHEFLGISPGPREVRPKNAFAYQVLGPQGVVQEASSGLGLGDMEVRVLLPIKRAAQLPLSFALSADLPTGSEKFGFSNGRTDWGLSLFGRNAQPDFHWGWSISRFFPSSFGNVRRISLRDFTSITLYGQIRQKWIRTQGKSAPLYLQFRWFESPFQASGISAWDRNTLELFMGVSLYHKGVPWFFGFSEDLAGGLTPDISFLLSTQWE